MLGWEGKWRELIPMGWGDSHRELKAKPRVLARRVHVPCGRDDSCSSKQQRARPGPRATVQYRVPVCSGSYVKQYWIITYGFPYKEYLP